jgi:nucleotide-binding universal stress UspA family protein
MLKILIPVDGSEHARHAIDAVAELAHAGAKLEVTLLNVRNDPIYYGELPPIGMEMVEEAQKKLQDDLLADAERYAKSLELPIASLQRAVGFAPNEIERVAREWRADQIAMGTRGMGAMGSLFLGSVAQRVVHVVTVPVLLVR